MKNKIQLLLTKIRIKPADKGQTSSVLPDEHDKGRTQLTLKNLIASITQQKEVENKECSYGIKKTRNTNTIIVECGECKRDSTLNNPICRSNIYQILLKETAAKDINF
jgi:hypothetical protein